MRVKKPLNIEIGERIRIARDASGLTQEQFAEGIGVSPQYVSDLERGVVGISLPTLRRACVVLSVTSDQILFGQQTRDRGAILGEKCAALEEEQFLQLTEIVSKIVEAITAGAGH